MSAHHNELRMVDDLDQADEVRSLLRAGIDDDVAGYDFEGGLATHMAAVAALPPAPSAPHVAPPAAAAGISGKALIAWIGVPVASASVIAALWFGGSAETERAQSNAVAKTVPVAPVASAPTSPAAPTAPVVTAPAAKPSVVAVVETVVEAPVAARNAHARPARAQRHSAAITHSVSAVATTQTKSGAGLTVDNSTDSNSADSTVADTAPIEVAPTAAEREEAARIAAAQAEQERLAREEARRVAEERLKREMAQLMRAKQSLTTNPAQALALAQAGEQEFRDSLFSEERQHVLLLALIKLGRVDEAERRAEPFLRAHPDSPFARRVRNALQDAK